MDLACSVSPSFLFQAPCSLTFPLDVAPKGAVD